MTARPAAVSAARAPATSNGARSGSTRAMDVNVSDIAARAVRLMIGRTIQLSTGGTPRLRLIDSHSTSTPPSTA